VTLPSLGASFLGSKMWIISVIDLNIIQFFTECLLEIDVIISW
jgi:hypothetical protein